MSDRRWKLATLSQELGRADHLWCLTVLTVLNEYERTCTRALQFAKRMGHLI